MFNQFPYKFKTVPYKHQFDAWDSSKDLTEFALLMEMGTGKSKVTIDTAAYLYDQGEIDAFVLVAPKGAYRNWDKKELPTHMPDHVPMRIGVWSSYRTKAVEQSLLALFDKNFMGLRVLVINVESLSILSSNANKFLGKFLQSFRCLMAVDESTTIKNPKANRSKAVVSHGRKSKYRRILTGQPITRNPLDIYGQFLFLNAHIFGNSFFAFRNRYAELKTMILGQRQFQKVVGFQRLDELQEKMRKHSFRVTKDECLDLPPKIYTVREVEMTDEQEKLYSQMKKKAFIEIQELGQTSAPIVITKLLRLHQIACGHLPLEDGTVMDIPNNRIAELLSVIEEINREKIIIWANYRRDIQNIYKALCEEYGKDCVVHYYGDTSDDERIRAVEEFQNGKVRFFIGNPATGKYSLTLTSSHDVIYFSNNYDLDARAQSEDRAHRIGQNKSVTYVDFVVPNTIDETILRALREKKELAALVVDGTINEDLL